MLQGTISVRHCHKKRARGQTAGTEGPQHSCEARAQMSALCLWTYMQCGDSGQLLGGTAVPVQRGGDFFSPCTLCAGSAPAHMHYLYNTLREATIPLSTGRRDWNTGVRKQTADGCGREKGTGQAAQERRARQRGGREAPRVQEAFRWES